MNRRRALRALLGSAGACALTLALVGCSDDPDPSADADGDSGLPTTAATPRPTPTTEPSAWPRADPASVGLDRKRLEREAATARRAGSSCLVVVRQGKLVGEWYWRGSDASDTHEIFSVTKSITSTLVGIAQAQGLVSVDDRASDYISEWRRTPSRTVTVRNLLSNDSGREWTTQGDYGELISTTDRTGYAVGLGQDHPPGTVWAYNNAAIQTLDRVLTTVTGEDTAEYAEQWLFAPLGMSDTRMSSDGSHRSTNVSFGTQSTCVDLARFGQLFLQRGTWDGTEIVPRSWVRAAVGAPSQELNAAYGFLWWLNRHGPQRGPLDEVGGDGSPTVTMTGQLAPGTPADAYAAQGLGGQIVLVDPGSQTVVVRLGEPLATRQAGHYYTFADAARLVSRARDD